MSEPPVTAQDLLEALGSTITDPDPAAADAALAQLGEASLAQLGRLAELATWWAGVHSSSDPGPPAQVLLAGGGLDAAARRPGVTALGLPRGGSVEDALGWGIRTADDAVDRGVDLVLLSVHDPAGTRPLAAELLGLDAVEATGWPAERGLSDTAWMDLVAALRDQLRRTRGLRDRPGDLLRAIGSPATAAAGALAVQITARRTPILLDGPGAAAIALLARRACYSASLWCQAAHGGEDRLHTRMLDSLGLDPLTRLGITVEDGTAAIAGLALLDLAAGLLVRPRVGPAAGLPE